MSPHVCIGLDQCEDCQAELVMQIVPELEEELRAMEAADPHLAELGARVDDCEAYMRGQPSRLGVHMASLRRMANSRRDWRNA